MFSLSGVVGVCLAIVLDAVFYPEPRVVFGGRACRVLSSQSRVASRQQKHRRDASHRVWRVVVVPDACVIYVAGDCCSEERCLLSSDARRIERADSSDRGEHA